MKFGRKIETEESYFLERRTLLDENGYKSFPLIIVSSLRDIGKKLEEVQRIIRSSRI